MTEPKEQIGSRIVRGGVWTAARQGVQQVCSLASLVIVARLVPPSEVGLFSMAMLVLTITRALTETGFEQALIQRAELDDAVLDVGYSVVLLRAAVVGLVMALGARFFAGFFGEPRVAELLRVLALGVLLEGFVNNRVLMSQRELDFRRYFFFQAAGQLTQLCVTIASAWLRHDVWSVVHGQLAGAGARVVASYVLSARRPQLRFSWPLVRELLGYGRWVSASSLLLFLLVQGDNLFVGKIVGAAALAYYNWAYQLANLPALFITQILSSVMFPALASVRADPARTGQLFLRSMRLTWLMSLPSALLIAALAKPFTQALLGERWLPIVPIAHALVSFGLLRAVGASAGALFLALGRPDLRAKVQFAQLAVFALSVYPLYRRFDVLGVAASVTLYSLLNVWAAYLAFRVCEVPVRALGRPSLMAALASLGGFAAALACAHALEAHAWPALLIGSAVGALSTLMLLHWLDRSGEVGQAVRALRRLRAS